MKKALFILLVAFGCDKIEDINHNKKYENSIITFGVPLETKGISIDASTISTMGVFGYYTGTEDWNNATSKEPNYFNNRKVERSSSSIWTYFPIEYWPADKNEKISFFAYSPHNNGVTSDYYIDNNNGSLVMHCITNEDISSQIDLLIAEPKVNLTNEIGGISFDFKHVLSKIIFKAKSENNIEEFYVDQIFINGIYYNGSISVDSKDAQWNVAGEKNRIFSLSGNFLNKSILQNNYIELNTNNQFMFLLPQTFENNDDAKIIINFKSSKSIDKQVEIKLQSTNVKFEKGKMTEIGINYKNGLVELTVENITIDSWTQQGDIIIL